MGQELKPENVQSMNDPEQELIEKLRAAKAAQSDDDDEDDDTIDEDALSERLQRASDVLKQSAILFEFLSDAELCTRITKRERDIIGRQIARIYDLTEVVDRELSELSDF